MLGWTEKEINWVISLNPDHQNSLVFAHTARSYIAESLQSSCDLTGQLLLSASC